MAASTIQLSRGKSSSPTHFRCKIKRLLEIHSASQQRKRPGGRQRPDDRQPNQHRVRRKWSSSLNPRSARRSCGMSWNGQPPTGILRLAFVLLVCLFGLAADRLVGPTPPSFHPPGRRADDQGRSGRGRVLREERPADPGGAVPGLSRTRQAERRPAARRRARPSSPAARPVRPSCRAMPRRACWSTPSTTAKPTRCRRSRSSPRRDRHPDRWVKTGVPGGSKRGTDRPQRPRPGPRDPSELSKAEFQRAGSTLELSAAPAVTPAA